MTFQSSQSKPWDDCDVTRRMRPIAAVVFRQGNCVVTFLTAQSRSRLDGIDSQPKLHDCCAASIIMEAGYSLMTPPDRPAALLASAK